MDVYTVWFVILRVLVDILSFERGLKFQTRSRAFISGKCNHTLMCKFYFFILFGTKLTWCWYNYLKFVFGNSEDLLLFGMFSLNKEIFILIISLATHHASSRICKQYFIDFTILNNIIINHNIRLSRKISIATLTY